MFAGKDFTVVVFSGRPAGELYDHQASVVPDDQEKIEEKLEVFEALAKRTGQWENWRNGPNYIKCESRAEAVKLKNYRLGLHR